MIVTVRQQNAKLQQPDSIVIPATSSIAGDASSTNDPMLSSSAIVPGMAGMATGMVDDFSMDYGQASYDVFDPLNWMLDGIVDFPYNFSSVQGSDLSGMDGLGGGI